MRKSDGFTTFMEPERGFAPILIVIVIALLLTMGFIFKEGPFRGAGDSQSSEVVEKFIVANPIDLSEIASISHFRSCMGHDYSGKNVDGQKESNRSMKHYLASVAELEQSTGKVKVFAPFDGKISSIEDEQNLRGNQVWIRGPSTGSWNFIFFHIDLIPELTKGSEVEVGKLIGYANLAGGANFDFGLKSIGFGSQVFETPFNYMTSDVLAEYEQRGLTPENVVIMKETRDANPCNFGRGSGEDEQVFLN